MQRTGNFHDGILGTAKAQPANHFDHATTFHPAVDMFNPDTQGCALAIERFLGRGQFAAFRFFEGRQTCNAVERKGQKAQVFS